MAPFYRRSMPSVQLHEDDISAVQALYGASATSPQAKPETPLRWMCKQEKVDVATTHEINGRMVTYVFIKDKFAVIRNGGILPGYPKPISYSWPGLPSNLDAGFFWASLNATVWRNGKSREVVIFPARTYFFKGNLCWGYENMILVHGFPRLISEEFRGIPDNIDAAFVQALGGGTFFIKGSCTNQVVNHII